MSTFSDHAYEKMMGLFDDPYSEVGSKLKEAYPDKYKNLKSTDCVTFVLNVLSYAFDKIGDAEAKSRIWKLNGMGTKISEYLVNNRNWLGIYINPDTRNPMDGMDRHPWSHYVAKAKCEYYKTPIKYAVVNYSPTRLTIHDKNKKETPINNVDIAALKRVKFGFGVSNGGSHVWLFSRGNVYEVHWTGVGNDLYGLVPLEEYNFYSGAIFIPPDQSTAFQMSALSCAR